MAGNVFEWLQDEWHDNYNNVPSDHENGWCTGTCPVNASDPNYDENGASRRVYRGGSWFSNAGSCTVSYRYNRRPDYRLDLGMRVTRSLE